MANKQFIDMPLKSVLDGTETIPIQETAGGAGSSKRTSADILIRDALRRDAEARSGGRVTVLYDAAGLPNYMHVIPKFRYEDLGFGTEMGTGVCTAFTVGGLEKSEIFVGQFLASGANAQSIAGADPANGLDYDEAVAACTAKGAGWHLMTVHEWAAIALWCMANGFQPRGNTDWGRAYDATWEVGQRESGGSPGVDDGTSGRTLTGSGPATWYHNGDHTGLADLVGNVWERNFGLKLVQGQVICTPDNDYTLPETDWAAQAAYFDSPAPSDGSGNLGEPILSDSITNYAAPDPASNGYADYNSISPWSAMTTAAGYVSNPLLRRLLVEPAGVSPQGYFPVRNYGERLPIRGGYWYNGGDAGLAALALYNPRSYRGWHIGFRPAFVA